jgi:putative molybdopterin biosynthesis protein
MIEEGRRMKTRNSEDRTEDQIEFYTVSQLADLLQLTEMTVYRMVNRGDLPHYEFGRMKRFSRGDIDDFLKTHRHSPIQRARLVSNQKIKRKRKLVVNSPSASQ